MAAIIVTGLTELNLRLALFTEAAQKKLIRKGLRKAAKPMFDAIKADAPKDEGDYETSIKLRAAKRSRKHKNSVAIQIRTDTKRLAEISEQEGQVFNPHWMEYGTSETTAQPHFRSGMDRSKAQVKSIFEHELNEIVMETALELRAAI